MSAIGREAVVRRRSSGQAGRPNSIASGLPLICRNAPPCLLLMGSSSRPRAMTLKPFENYWLDHGELDDRDYSRLILRSGSEPDWAEPPHILVVRLDHAVAAVASLQATAVATIQWLQPVSGYQEWAPIEFRIETDGSLWIDFVEWHWDEYSRWAVRFDAADSAVEIRRRAFQLPAAKPEDNDRLMWRL